MRDASLPETFARPLTRLGARGGRLVRRVVWFDRIDSTNTVAVSFARRGEPEGTLVLAGEQTAGRGRRGRTWVSPAGAGVYASFLLRPSEPRPLLTLAAGVAVATGIAGALGVVCDLKWPNDLLVRGRKVAGLLAEGGTASGNDFVVLGVGINVRAVGIPPELQARTTSLEAECGRPVDRGVVLAEVVAALSEAYDRLMIGPDSAILHAWRAEARASLGREVEWEGETGVSRGVACGIDTTGALLVRTTSGRCIAVTREVRWS